MFETTAAAEREAAFAGSFPYEPEDPSDYEMEDVPTIPKLARMCGFNREALMDFFEANRKAVAASATATTGVAPPPPQPPAEEPDVPEPLPPSPSSFLREASASGVFDAGIRDVFARELGYDRHAPLVLPAVAPSQLARRELDTASDDIIEVDSDAECFQEIAPREQGDAPPPPPPSLLLQEAYVDLLEYPPPQRRGEVEKKNKAVIFISFYCNTACACGGRSSGWG